MRVEELKDGQKTALTETANIRKPAAAAPAPAPEQDFIEMDLDQLIKMGAIERDITVQSTVFKMRTLTEQEKSEVDDLLQDNALEDDAASMERRLRTMKRPLLSRSIVQINHVPFDTPDKKKKLEGVLQKMQDTLITYLFAEYIKLVNDQKELFAAGLKKNSQ